MGQLGERALQAERAAGVKIWRMSKKLASERGEEEMGGKACRGWGYGGHSASGVERNFQVSKVPPPTLPALPGDSRVCLPAAFTLRLSNL